MKACLFVATLSSLFGALLCVVSGVSLLSSSQSGWNGLLLIFLGTPYSIASAIVFDFVRSRWDDERPVKEPVRMSDTKGTPWEKNPGHTR